MNNNELLGIAQLWNSVEEIQRREPKKRDYISATDLGNAFLDRWYKMKGVEVSNPYDSRTLRIFAAGNTFEDLVIEILAKAEVLIDTQGYVEIPATKKTLKVLGYYDATIGNVKSWKEKMEIFKKRCVIEEKILKQVEEIYSKEKLNVPTHYYRFSNYIKWQGEKILKGLAKMYPKGMPEKIMVEIKSVNSNAFWNKKNYIGVGYPHHLLQTYTYMKATKIEKGSILYISKDDLSLEECRIFLGSEDLEEKWKKDIMEMSYYILNNKKPKAEPSLMFEEKAGKNGLWKINWKLGRSPYLTKITGYPDSNTWEKEARNLATPLNRKLGKAKKNEINTNKNK